MSKYKFLVIGVLLLVLSQGVAAQKQTINVEQTWLNYFNQTRFSEKWGVWLDASLRTKENWIEDFSQAIGRVGITYYLGNYTKLTAGYAYIHHFPSDNHPNIAMPEHRPWQQIQWHNNRPNLRLMQWVRSEERFRRKIKSPDELAEGYNFNYRVRYNLMLALPLAHRPFAPGTFSGVINNEVHLNFGDEITYNTFDQNRLFLGFFYHINNHDQLQAGYMNLYQQLASGNRYRSVHTARISFFHNLDLRSKNKGS